MLTQQCLLPGDSGVKLLRLWLMRKRCC